MNAVTRHEMAVMDGTGDTKTLWDPDNEDEVANARSVFEHFKAKGFSIFHVGKEGEKAKIMQKFDPDAAKMIAVPVIVGG